MSAGLKSRIVATLSALRGIARQKKPVEGPLIMRTNYYENIRIMGEYLLFIYYAPYGHGKTHGVGLKLYHEARVGELSDTHDVVLMQLRNLGPMSDISSIMQAMKKANIDSATAFVAASLIVGFSANRCGSRVQSLCYSTYVDRISGNPTLPVNQVIKGLMDEGREYLVKLLDGLSGNRTIVLVFDEFEALIKGDTFTPYNTPLLYFLSDLGKLMRWLDDRGVRKLKIVLLVQEALVRKDLWENLERRLKASGAWGITVLQRIDPYPPRVYAEFVFEAVERLVKKRALYNSGWVRTLLQNKHSLLGDFEKVFVHISRIPPRIAFSIADEYIGTLAEQAVLTNGDIRELKSKIKDAYKETISRLSMIDEVIRLQDLYLSGRSIYSDKSSFGNRENMLRIVNAIADEVLNCGKWRANIIYSTFYGVACVKGIMKNELIVDVLLIKLKYSSRSTVRRVSETIGKEIAKKVAEAVESFIIDTETTQRIRTVKVRIYPIVGRDSSTTIYTAIAGTKPVIRSELGKKLAKAYQNIFGSRPNVRVDIMPPYVVDGMKAITLYAWIIAQNKIGFVKDYVEKSYEETIDEIRTLWT